MGTAVSWTDNVEGWGTRLFAEHLLRSGSCFGVLNDRIDFELQKVCPFDYGLVNSCQVCRFNETPAKN